MIPISAILGRIGFVLAILPLFSAPAPARAGVTLAAVEARTGMARDDGLPALEGMRLAVSEINAAGGLFGEPLTLAEIDHRSTPIGAKQAGEEAVRLGVQGVVGAVWSGHSMALARVCQEAGVPMISPGSTRPELTRVGDFVFRVCYTDDFQGRILAGFARETLKAETAAVLVNCNEPYSQTLAEFFSRDFVRRGGRRVHEDFYKGDAVDFSDLLRSAAETRPDLIFVPGYSRDSGLLLRQARALGLASVFLGADAWDGPIERYAGEALEGSFFSNHWHPGIDSPENRAFLAAFRRTYGDRDICAFAALGYDAAMLFADAIRRAGSTDRAAVRAALAATREFRGATGAISFDEHGDPEGKIAVILTRKNGQWRLVRMVGAEETADAGDGSAAGSDSGTCP